MADTKISDLTAVTTPAATDELAVNQGGTSKKLTLAQAEQFKPTAGGYYWSAQGTAAVAVAGTFVKVSTATSTVSSRAENFTISTNNRATYTGAVTRTFMVLYAVSMTAESNNVITGMKIAKNGTPIDASLIHRKVGTGTDEGAAAVMAVVELAEDDYVELWATNEGGTGDVYIEHGNCVVLPI